jgi:hypothetical protein
MLVFLGHCKFCLQLHNSLEPMLGWPLDTRENHCSTSLLMANLFLFLGVLLIPSLTHVFPSLTHVFPLLIQIYFLPFSDMCKLGSNGFINF